MQVLNGKERNIGGGIWLGRDSNVVIFATLVLFSSWKARLSAGLAFVIKEASVGLWTTSLKSV